MTSLGKNEVFLVVPAKDWIWPKAKLSLGRVVKKVEEKGKQEIEEVKN